MKFRSFVNLSPEQLLHIPEAHRVTIDPSVDRTTLILYPTIRLAQESLKKRSTAASYLVSTQLGEDSFFEAIGSVEPADGSPVEYVAGLFYSYSDAFKASHGISSLYKDGRVVAVPRQRPYDSYMKWSLDFNMPSAVPSEVTKVDLRFAVELDDPSALVAADPQYAEFLRLKEKYEPAKAS
ncbi:hypothetical protein ACX80Z_15860 [Arthrobacter sp. TMT4-20]